MVQQLTDQLAANVNEEENGGIGDRGVLDCNKWPNDTLSKE